MKMIINCAYCGKEVEKYHWQIKPGRLNHCSLSCNAKRKKESGYLGPVSISSDRLEELRIAYTQTQETIVSISQRLGICRATIFAYARKNGWKKPKRSRKIRSIYRNNAEAKIGRKLLKGEHVHHIDGDQLNNEKLNLHIFDGPKTHSEAHGSLEQAAFVLFKRGLIVFDVTTGRYSLAST